VTLLGGTWRLEHCSIESSRPKHRACAGVVLRGGARLELVDCTISTASSAVQICDAECSLLARGTTFRNVRTAVFAERGGRITVTGCAFETQLGSDVALRLSADTRGAVRGNTASGPRALWGRLLPPAGVEVDTAAGGEVDQLPL